MITKHLDIETHAGKCDSFLCYPDESKQYPAVILFMDAFGPRAYLFSMAEKIASLGYYVLLPNLFYQQKRAPIVDCDFPVTKEKIAEARKQFMPLFNHFDWNETIKDFSSWLNFLDHQPQVKHGKIGITGYCMGGALALRAAAHFPDRVGAVASFHGGNLATDKSDSPHLLLNSIHAQVYIAHADQDGSMPPEQIERLEVALANSSCKYQVELYSKAQHGFTMMDLPAYNQGALEKHWLNLEELLQNIRS
jgi:carboxymethylenebutenolidase